MESIPFFDRKEDFAESVTAYVYPGEAQRRAEKMNYPYTDANRNYSYSNFMDTPRGQHIAALIVTIP